jgi:WD40 repeat protein
LELEHVLGFTTTKNTGLAIHPSEEILAYLAGSVVVLYNVKRNRQIAHLVATAAYVPAAPPDIQQPNGAARNTAASDKKAKEVIKVFSCVAFSSCGNFVAAGEMGHHPRILVWEMATGNLVMEMQSHRFGVLSICFSPNNKYLVTLGFQHDGFLCVWNWKNGVKLASNKISTKVHSLAFSADGSFCVTAGLRCLKFWYFDANGNLPPSKVGGGKAHVKVLEGRMGVLGDLKSACFVDAACGRGPDGSEYTYIVTQNGLLCLFIKGRILDRWIDLQVKSANSVHVTDNLIVCGCSDGIVRLFEPVTLNYIGTVPKPFNLGMELELDSKPEIYPDGVFPDTLGVRVSAEGDKLCCIYSDRSMLVWEIKEEMRVSKMRSFLYHSDVVWGAEMVPAQLNADAEERHRYPDGTFATYSSDGTVRFWNWNNLNQRFTIFDDKGKPLRRMGLSKELLQIHYMDPEWKQIIKDKKAPTDTTSNTVIADPSVGIRTLRISQDGVYMATGDRLGNLRVHTLKGFDLQVYHEAHDAEIMTLDFSCAPLFKDYPYMLTSAGRDRLLHIFDVRNKFQLLQTLDDHSSSILSVTFSDKGRKLVSLGLDKSILFRNTTFQKDTVPFYSTYHIHSDRMTLYEMDLDEFNEQLAVVTQNRCVSVFDVASGKQTASHKSSTVDDPTAPDGSLIHVKLDPSASYAVTAGTDKRVRLVDMSNGACLAVQGGHSEMITSVRFTDDCKRVISTAADGCVFLWKVDKQIASAMNTRRSKLMDGKQAKDQAELEAMIAQQVDEAAALSDVPVDEAEREATVKLKVHDILARRARKSDTTVQNLFTTEGTEAAEEDVDSGPSEEESDEEEEEIESTDKMNFKVTQTPKPTKLVMLAINEDDADDTATPTASAIDSDDEVKEIPFIRTSFHDYLEGGGPMSIFTPRNRNSISANYLMTVRIKQQVDDMDPTKRRRSGLSSIRSDDEAPPKSPRSPISPAHSPTHARVMRRGPYDNSTVVPDNDLSLIQDTPTQDAKAKHRRSLSSPQDTPNFAQPTKASRSKVVTELLPPPRSSSVGIGRRKTSHEQLDKKAELQAEVERTRQRLAQLGFFQNSNKSSSQKDLLGIPPPPRRRRSRTAAADLSENDRAPRTPDLSPVHAGQLLFSTASHDHCIHCTLGSSTEGQREASLLNKVRELRGHMFNALQEYQHLTDGSHPASNEQQSILNLIKDDFTRMRQDLGATFPDKTPSVAFNVTHEQPKDFTHLLLENYSDLLMNMVQEKLSKL